MGQVPPKYFLPSTPYGSSQGADTLNKVNPAAVNPQTPLLPPNFTDQGTMQGSSFAGARSPLGPQNANPGMARLFGRGLF